MTSLSAELTGRALFDCMVESVAAYESDGEIVYVNPVTCKVFGRTEAELVGQNLWDVFPEARGNTFHQAFSRAARDGSVQRFESFHEALSRWYVNHVYRADGRLWVISRDITEKKAAAARLEILANASRVFSEAAGDVHTAFEKISRHVAEVLRDMCSIRLLSEDGTMFEAPVGAWDVDVHAREILSRTPPIVTSDPLGAEIMRTGEPILMAHLTTEEIASRIPDPAGRAVVEALGFHSAVVVPLRSQGRMLGLFSVGRRREGTKIPFTEADVRLLEELADRAALVVNQRRAFRLLESTAEELRAAVTLRDEFLSIASHELRTPLTALDLQLEGLQRAFESGVVPMDVERARRKLATASRQVGRLSTLIDGFLNVTRIEMNRVQLELEEFDVDSLIRDVVERFEEESLRTGSKIEWSLLEPPRVRWDRARIEHALTNLLSNALKYGEGKAVLLVAKKVENRLTISVRDHGIGIAPTDHERIFQRFARAVSKNHYGGLGLGLYVASEHARAHGGGIVVNSDLGAGSEFTLTLPLHVLEPTEDGERRSSS